MPKSITLNNGLIRLDKFNSKYVPERPIDIWLPRGYIPTKSYAVLYMHDGQMLFDSTTTWNGQEWGVDEEVQKLIDQKDIKETIVVAIWNSGKSRHSEYFPQAPFDSLEKEFQDSLLYKAKRPGEEGLFAEKVYADAYLKFIVEELKPYVDKHYSTLKDAENTSIAGSSMGGLISMYAICEYPKVFGSAACISTHWIGTFSTENNPIPTAFIQYLDLKLPSPRTHRLYFDHGTATLDSLYGPYQKQVDKLMIDHGYTISNWMTYVYEGADHSEKSWQARLEIPLKFLLGL